MKKLLLIAILAFSGTALAQAPIIEGDTMMCPWTDGTATITGNTTYDSYQWYSKYWFMPDEFVAIEGATEATFTYDWYNYDQSLFKVEVTLGGNTYESNTIQIDSYAWSGMTLIGDDTHVTFDPDTQSFALCEGATFPNTVNSPYTANIQWYKDDEIIEGANNATYEIHEAGTYYVRATTAMCPQTENSAQSLPLQVYMDPNCTMGTTDPEAGIVSIFPNPAKDILNLQLAQDSGVTAYTIFDITGKKILSGNLTDTRSINVSSFAAGTYLLQLAGDKANTTKRFIKQ